MNNIIMNIKLKNSGWSITLQCCPGLQVLGSSRAASGLDSLTFYLTKLLSQVSYVSFLVSDWASIYKLHLQLTKSCQTAAGYKTQGLKHSSLCLRPTWYLSKLFEGKPRAFFLTPLNKKPVFKVFQVTVNIASK